MKLLMAGVLAACFALAVVVGYVSSSAFEVRYSKDAAATQTAKPTFAPTTPPSSFYSVSIKLPAVSKSGQGALADFTVAAASGEGKLFLRFDSGTPLTNPDTQYSLRNAFDVAKTLSNADTGKIDVYYYFSADSDVVGGQSAGAAMAVATLAAISKTPLKDGVLITGQLNADGTVGRVGKVLAKAEAAKAAGYATLLVPEGEAREARQVQECKRESVEGTDYQSCTTRQQEVSVAEETGMEIIEVSDVKQAFDLMKE